MSKVHSVISASSAYRWLNCPASVRLAQGMTERTSEAADEGTAAHMLAEKCLKEGLRSCALWRGATITVPSERAYEVDQEMQESVDLYLNTVLDDLKAMQPGANLRVEQHFDLSWLHPDIFGTNDAIITQDFGLMRIYDLKYGKGVVVEAEDNAQLKIYALGGLVGSTCEEAEVIIVQPRAPHSEGGVRRSRISLDDLYGWANETLLPGAMEALKGDAPARAGDWCRFCRAIAVCPAVRSEASQAAMVAFENAKVLPSLPSPGTMTPEQISKVLLFSKMFSTWAEEVEAHAKMQMERGTPIPGWKLVHGRASRKWESEPKVIAALANYGTDIYTDPELLSPAQMEKMIKAKGDDPAATLAGLITTTRGVSVAHESDKREAILPLLSVFDPLS